ncbi:MAG: hypothetical protein HYT72_01155 [Candidatus Aenigmarchaeota archaeon]|nr:hypothetical protein [Candidatus Aenigmarchaeota archaeon]
MFKRLGLVFALILSVSAFAHEEVRTPEEMINQMLITQNASAVKQIDCGKIPDGDFEMLGEAVMERMAGSHELHEQMDSMMGGESTQTQMHTLMGKNWLSCGTGLMGGGMMGMAPMMMRMMGNYYPAYYNGFDAILILTVIGWVLFFVTLYLYSTRQKRHRK